MLNEATIFREKVKNDWDVWSICYGHILDWYLPQMPNCNNFADVLDYMTIDFQ